jgi:hypothetical protein
MNIDLLEFPMLVINEENGICDIGNIFDKLRDIGYTLPQEDLFKSSEKCDIIAYTALLEKKLYYCQV